ncbi:MAG: hypothetical protein ACLUCE_07585 [Streptococcus sp.]|uniref:hypothetical protein n=1 Tax=Streptococcus sp. TaxID=1306 RepID=UPI003995FCDA
MAIGQNLNIQLYTNYLGEDGAEFIGWHTIDSKRYYFKPDGLMAKNDTRHN